MPAEYGVISFRVPVAEYDAIQQAAQGDGESMSTFVRKAIAQRLRGATGEVGEYVASGSAYKIREAVEQNGISTLLVNVTEAPTPQIRIEYSGAK